VTVFIDILRLIDCGTPPSPPLRQTLAASRAGLKLTRLVRWI